MNAPQEYLDFLENLKKILQNEYEIVEFLSLGSVTPTDIYHEDIKKRIGISELFVAICDYPSTGLGYEMATAIEKYSKPTIGLAKEGKKISTLISGIDHPMYTFKSYKTIEDIIASIKEKELKHFK